MLGRPCSPMQMLETCADWCEQALQLRGAHVTLTDCAVQLPLLQRNVAANFGKPCPHALAFIWPSAQGQR